MALEVSPPEPTQMPPPVPPEPLPLPLPVVATGAGLGTLGLLGGLFAALHARDYASLKPVLRQLSSLAGAAGVLSMQGLSAPSAEAAVAQAAKAASKKFLPFLYLRFRKHTFILRREEDDDSEGILIRKVRLRFRSEATVQLDVSEDLDKLGDGCAEVLRIRHPRKAMRGLHNVEVAYLYGDVTLKRSLYADEHAFEPVMVIDKIKAPELAAGG